MQQARTVAAASSTLNPPDAYWKLDEASGTRVDSGANGQDLTDNNTVTSATGKISDAGDFEFANSEYLSRADSPTLSLGIDTDFTIACWVYAESYSAFNSGIFIKDLATQGASLTTEYGLVMDNSTTGYFRFGVGNGTTFQIVTASTMGFPSTATWYLIVAWHDSAADTISIQVNNGTVDSAAWAGGTQDAASAMNIGSMPANGALAWDGLIDETGFWKRVLTAGERTELYNSNNGKTCCPF